LNKDKEKLQQDLVEVKSSNANCKFIFSFRWLLRAFSIILLYYSE
jgi:hypothetical protein